MAYFYLSSAGLDNLELDQNVINITLPDLSRQYNAENLFSDGAVITGNGSIIPGQITFSMIFHRKYKISGTWTTYLTAFNAFRNSVMRYFGLARYLPVYFNMVDASGNTLRQQVYPITKSGESYQYGAAISGETSFTFQMAKSYFYNTAAASSTYTVLSTGQEIFSVVNNGALSVAPMFSFVPSTGFTSFQIQLYYGNYGFTLGATFLTGQTITFDCSTGIVTQNGNVVAGIQSAGSIFNIPTGTVTMYITACPGTLTTSYNERYV